jgi:CBS domain-containing protein
MTDLRARDLMQADVISVNPETPLLELHRLFVEEEINGAPVVDDGGDVVGVISSMDLLRAVLDRYETGSATNAAAYFREASPYSGPDWSTAPDDFQDRLRDLTVEEAMIRELVTVPPTATLAEIAGVMRKQRIHRVLVIEDGDLVGILTTYDLLRALEQAAQPRRSSALPRQAGDPVC